MERLSTSAFKLRSGNKPSIAKMAGVSPMKHYDETQAEDHDHPHSGTKDGVKGTYHSEKEYDFRPDYKGNKRLGLLSDEEKRQRKKDAKKRREIDAKKPKLPTGVYPTTGE